MCSLFSSASTLLTYEGINETDTPISVLLCVIYFQGHLHCCDMKGLDETATPIFVLYVFFIFKGNDTAAI